MPTMRAERGGSAGEVGPLKATVAPPATEQEHEVMRPPSEIKWPEVKKEKGTGAPGGCDEVSVKCDRCCGTRVVRAARLVCLGHRNLLRQLKHKALAIVRHGQQLQVAPAVV